ncbi:hypothetical protein EC991_002974, partial [Linnemannia zychae]
MSSTTTQFLGIPEMTDMVVAHLNKHDIAMLVLTCSQLHRRYESALYTDLTLGLNVIFQSSQATRALARNIHRLQSLKLNVVELAMLFNCMLAYLDDATEDKGIGMSTGTHIHQPEWLPSRDQHSQPIIPIPPLTNLKTLETDFSPMLYAAATCPYYLASCNWTKISLYQFCWILGLNPGLIHVTASSPTICYLHSLQVLAGSISKLSHLQGLFVDSIVTGVGAWTLIGMTLFLSCSPNVHTLAIQISTHTSVSQSAIKSSWGDLGKECSNPLASLKSIPREGLRDFSMWPLGKVNPRHDLLSALELCPNLKRLSLPEIEGSLESSSIGRSIGTMCPKLLSLNILGLHHSNQGVTSTPIKIMTQLPRQQIEEFKWTNTFERLDEGKTSLMFLPHSEVLRKLVFEHCHLIKSNGIQNILTICPVLEHLQVRVERCPVMGSYIELQDAIDSPWVCKKLKVLELGVMVPKMADLESNQGPYYKRSPTVRLSDAETDLLAQYEQFYRQIGSLTSLTHLTLQAVSTKQGNPSPVLYYQELEPFPAMLTLGNGTSGRPGFLNLLAGLTQLKELQGSVDSNNDEAKETMRWEEAQWMKQHWPSLEV